ncbi:winged helix-turn-helix transcriptional regulator [uncultured Erythrobacter sp.]|uniref:winged helix-turn-helix transcriptional regulator n=1 Tax=uncultured Erythrobacter sp. TaxID=263913 RepID=UPI0026262035|nr:winged helix-turn-helix transcriptional regulator [uncultured Erythrobacter sp.]
MDAKNPTGKDAYFAAVDALGDAWTFLITREAFFGAARFQDFCDRLNISRARLTERLKHLIETGIFERHQYNEAPPRFEYRFTAKGRAVYPIALSMIAWGEEWRSEPGASKLIHKACGKPLSIRTVCTNCRQQIRSQDLVWPRIGALKRSTPGTGSVRGWRKMASFDDISDRPDPAVDMLKAVGDRWSMLIVYGALQTQFRFRDAQKTLGVADTILSDRLKHLARQGILQRTHSSKNAAYRATDAGLAILDPVLVMRTWALDWAPKADKPWAELVHKPCGADVRTVCVCGHCQIEIDPRDVSY